MKQVQNEIRDLKAQARSLREMMQDQSTNGPALQADDLLLFLYRLRDGYRVVHSSVDHHPVSSFAILRDLLYQLESRPEQTLRSEEWKKHLDTLLRDLAEGNVTILKLTD